MADTSAVERAHTVFDPIAAGYLARPGVDIGPMFGSQGLRVRGKVFAFVTSHGLLALKLPEARIDEIEDGSVLARMVMRERSMREWLTVSVEEPSRWAPLVGEAYAFVDSITP